MHTWVTTDADGNQHAWTAAPLGVSAALAILPGYQAYKMAVLQAGAVVPDASWMAQILWGSTPAHRDGRPVSAAEAEFIFAGGNLSELVEAAEERAKAQGFFDIWMRSLLRARRPKGDTLPATPSPPASSPTPGTP